MSFILLKDDRNLIMNSLPTALFQSLSKNVVKSLPEGFTDPIPSNLIDSIPKSFIQFVPENLLLSAVPDLIDGEVFELFHNHYIDRMSLPIPSTIPVNISNDSKIVEFSETTMKNLLTTNTTPGEIVVFRYICESDAKNFADLNITPVIMDSQMKTILRYSNVDGNGKDLVSDANSIAMMRNYEERQKALIPLTEFKYDRCGVAFDTKTFINRFTDSASINVFFMLETFKSAYLPKIHIAISLAAEFAPYKNKFKEFIQRIAIYNHGSECC